jgi:hypothetical protein
MLRKHAVWSMPDRDRCSAMRGLPRTPCSIGSDCNSQRCLSNKFEPCGTCQAIDGGSHHLHDVALLSGAQVDLQAPGTFLKALAFEGADADPASRILQDGTFAARRRVGLELVRQSGRRQGKQSSRKGEGLHVGSGKRVGDKRHLRLISRRQDRFQEGPWVRSSYVQKSFAHVQKSIAHVQKSIAHVQKSVVPMFCKGFIGRATYRRHSHL